MRLFARGISRLRCGWQTRRSYKDRWIKRSNVNEFEVNTLKTLRSRLVALATAGGFESSRAKQIGESNDLSGSLAVATRERCESAGIRLP
jgi:hypothetical protein